MDDTERNPSSQEAVLAHGVPSQSELFSPAHAPVEATEAFHGSSGRESAEGDVPISAAPDPDAFMWNSLELGSPIDVKMQSVNLIGSPDALLPEDMWNVLELASPIVAKMEGASLTDGSSDSRLPHASVSVVEGEGRREAPLSKEDEPDGDGGSDKSEASDSESGELSESDESSSEDSDSSTSISSEDEEGYDGSHGVQEVPFESDDEEEVLRGPIKSRNEIEVLPLVPRVEVSLEPHHQTIPVGVISSVLGSRVVIEGSANHKPLNEGSVLWITETRSPLGIIDEIFGPVKNPYYVVRYNSEKDVPSGINNDTAVSFVMDFANYVLDKDLNKKGYDASGENDEEISDEPEFSDDEKEAEYKKAMRQAKRGIDDREFGKKENGFSKKNTHVKGARAQKGKMPHGRHGPGNLVQPVPCQNGPNMLPSLPVSSVGDTSNPSYQQPQQPNAILDQRMMFPQQMTASTVYQLPRPMPMPIQQQENALWPFVFPPQQLLNPILTHGIQHQPIAPIPGLQMNWPPIQQLRNEAYLQEHQNHGFMDYPFRMPSQQPLIQMFGAPAMPPMGLSNPSTAGLMSPMLLGQTVTGQVSSVHSERGVPGLGNPQFNPGSSSVRGSKSHQRGGHSFRRGRRR